MSAPSKPWENTTQNNNSSSYLPLASDLGPISVTRRAVVQGGLPPLPPRLNRLGMYSRYSSYTPGLMSAYGGGYGAYGGLGAYGGGYPYNGMRGQEFENRYVQIAEESAAPAFESIESFVRGFSAVTMMLESTFQAVHMSFRAVLSVAENMSRMKAAVFDFLSALTIFKTIYFFYRKVLNLLGLVNGAEVSWQQAEMATAASAGSLTSMKSSSSSKWPMLAFLGAIIAGPTLVYKYLLPDGIPEDQDILLIASHDFDAEQANELSFRKGDQLHTKRSQLKTGWIMARKGTSKGYIPSNRIKIVVRKPVQDNPPLVQGNPPSVQGMTPLVHGTTPLVQGTTSLAQTTTTPLVQGTTPLVQGNPPLVQGNPPSVQGTTPMVQGTMPSGQNSTPLVQGNPPLVQVELTDHNLLKSSEHLTIQPDECNPTVDTLLDSFKKPT